MVAKGRSKTNLMAPYFVQLRDFERRLMRDAIEAGGGPIRAAELLGVDRKYLFARAKHLGGVISGEPVHEPPEYAKKAWYAGEKAAREATAAEETENNKVDETAGANTPPLTQDAQS
jgi:hypothetical protein